MENPKLFVSLRVVAGLFIIFCFASVGQTSAAENTAASIPPQLQELDKQLEKIAAYEFGQSRESLIKLADIIREAHGSPELLKQIEKRLLVFLCSDATLTGKQFVCRQLSVIGTKESVPTLDKMLTSPDTSDMARYALERIQDPAVDDVLNIALDKTSGKIKAGIINSLAERGDEAAVMPLSKLLSDPDKEIAQAAAAALGKIAGQAAAAKLNEALKRSSGDRHTVLVEAYLACADKFAASGNKSAALAIYRQLYVPSEPTQIRSAALEGMITAEPEKAVGLVVDVLKGSDPAMQAEAISFIRLIPAAEVAQAVAAEMPNLSPAGQVQLLSALADRKDTSVLPVVVTAAKAPQKEVRIAALKALASLGNASMVVLLAQTAATADEAESQTARESLCLLNGPGVDETIVTSISQAEPKVKIELIRSVGRRNIREALETLLKTAQDTDDKVRLESLKALGDIATPANVPELVKVLKNSQNETELAEAEKTVITVSHKSDSTSEGTAAVLGVIDSVKEVNLRCAMLRILGGLGDNSALGVLQKALKDDNADVQTTVIRALGDWPNAAPADNLLETARNSGDQVRRTLALRGYVRLIGLESARSAEETVKMYGQAMKLAVNTDEKKTILSALANVKAIESLEMTSAYLDDEALQKEAGSAVVKIAEDTIKSEPDKTKAVLKKVLETTKSDSLRKKLQKLIDGQ
ncbi:MAG: HEAT repeat domain-containing protein [Phycisphaerae bacterium]|nr:HEAT repeat domain-containing protein [Phycisphaerae bacterium]